MLKWIGYLLLIALIIAIITAPSTDKFIKFANDKTSGSACKPLVDYRSYKAVVTFFGIGHITECKKGTTGIYDPQTKQTVGNLAIPAYGERENYLGLFGKFWKL